MRCYRVTGEARPQPEGMVVLDGTEAADDNAASATAFAQQLLASKARAQVQPSISSQHEPVQQTFEAGEQPVSHSRHCLGQGLQHEAQMRGSRGDTDESRKTGSQSDDDLEAVVIGDSDDDLELLDRDEERRLLSKFDDTAVDMEALPDVSPPLSPQRDTRSAQEDSSRGKENVAMHTSADPLPRSSAHPECAQQEALFRKHGGGGEYSWRPRSAQQGRKQLRRLYGPNSMPDHQLSFDATAGGNMSDEEPDFLTSDLMDAGHSREARKDILVSKQDSLGFDSVSADDVSHVEELTGSVGAVRSSIPSQDTGQRASAALKKPTQAAWHVLGSLRPDQDSNDSWGCSLPRSSGQTGSASPSTSQHRSCGQVSTFFHLLNATSVQACLSERASTCCLLKQYTSQSGRSNALGIRM